MSAIYDLKGSTFGRKASNGATVLKDLDFTERSGRLLLGPERRQSFLKQIEVDVRFLERNNIMDYSLLLGIRDMEAENTPAPAINIPTPPAPPAPPASSPSTSPRVSMMRSRSWAMIAPAGTSITTLMPMSHSGSFIPTLTGTSFSASPPHKSASFSGTMTHPISILGLEETPIAITPPNMSPPPSPPSSGPMVANAVPPTNLEEDHRNERLSIFQKDEAGFQSTTEQNNSNQKTIYYLGIIDIFTQYNIKKQLEHTYKSTIYETKDQISVVDSATYAKRFQKYISSIVGWPKSDEEKLQNNGEAQQTQQQ